MIRQITTLFLSIICFSTIAQTTYPYYDISTVTTENSQGVADSLFVYCKLSGVVYRGNFRPRGYDFQIITIENGKQEGIEIFNFNRLSYTVKEGDSIDVYGRVEQFRGRTQLLVDSIVRLDSFIVLVPPLDVTLVSEATESKLVRYRNLVITNIPGSQQASYNMIVSDGNKSFTVRIDSDTPIWDSLFSNPFAIGDTICSIVGIGSQFGSSPPYLSGYQIFPYWFSDLDRNSCKSACTIPNAAFTISSDTICFSDSLQLTSTSTGTLMNSLYLWDAKNDGIIDDTSQNGLLGFHKAGYNQIELTVIQGFCSDTIVDSVFVLANNYILDTAYVCKGGSYTFPDNFTVSNINSSFNYTSSFQAVNSCDSIIETSIQLDPDSIDNNVNQLGVILTAVQSNASYQWFNCSTMVSLPADTFQTFIAQINGNYAVAISKGQCVDTSSCYTVISVGLEEGKVLEQLVLYPNPTVDGIVNFSKINSAVVYDLRGKEVMSYRHAIQLDVNSLDDGIYFIRTSEGQTLKIVVQ